MYGICIQHIHLYFDKKNHILCIVLLLSHDVVSATTSNQSQANDPSGHSKWDTRRDSLGTT